MCRKTQPTQRTYSIQRARARVCVLFLRGSHISSRTLFRWLPIVMANDDDPLYNSHTHSHGALKRTLLKRRWKKSIAIIRACVRDTVVELLWCMQFFHFFPPYPLSFVSCFESVRKSFIHPFVSIRSVTVTSTICTQIVLRTGWLF